MFYYLIGKNQIELLTDVEFQGIAADKANLASFVSRSGVVQKTLPNINCADSMPVLSKHKRQSPLGASYVEDVQSICLPGNAKINIELVMVLIQMCLAMVRSQISCRSCVYGATSSATRVENWALHQRPIIRAEAWRLSFRCKGYARNARLK